MTELGISARVKARALKDPAFRQAMLNDPQTVLANEYKIQLPEYITVRVLEEAPDTLTIVLPPLEETMLELDDSDLEAVAGGINTLPGNFTCNVLHCEFY